MNGGINDAVVIGVVLCLLFAAVSYYLYSRVAQLEKKVGYMENILLDFKTTFEQTVMDLTSEAPAPTPSGMTERSPETEIENEQDDFVPATTEDVRQVQLEPTRPRPTQSPTPVQIVRDEKPAVTVNYEANTYKELLQIAKQKGVTGGSHMSKGELIAAIRRKDAGLPVKEAPATWTAFMESQAQQGSVQGTPISVVDDDKEEGIVAEPVGSENDSQYLTSTLDAEDESFVE